MLYLLILIVGGVASYFGPWWVIAPVCFVLCWLKSRQASHAFWISALAGLTLWLGYATYLHVRSGIDLVDKVAGIFTAGIPALSNVPGIVIVFIIMALVAFLISGFSGLAGVKIRQFMRQSAG